MRYNVKYIIFLLIDTMKLKNALIETIFWIHLIILIIWFGLFLFPSSVWPNKIPFHFWFIAVITIIQFLWGLTFFKYTKKIDIICPLTSWMQYLRGFPLKSKENLKHSFIAEILKRLKINVSYKFVSYLLLVTFFVVSLQYICFTFS